MTPNQTALLTSYIKQVKRLKRENAQLKASLAFIMNKVNKAAGDPQQIKVAPNTGNVVSLDDYRKGRE